MYFKFDKADITIVIVYVHDVLFMGSNPKLMKKEKGKFMKVWESRDLGEAKEYLGMRITRDRKKRTLTLDQCVYAEKVLKRFGTQNAKPMLEETSNYPNRRGHRCQWVITQKVSKTEAPSDLRSQYQSVIGSLLYIMLGTLPSKLSCLLVDQTTENCSIVFHRSRIHGHVRHDQADILDKISPRRNWFFYTKSSALL